MIIEKNKHANLLYLEVYNYYKDLILSNRLSEGQKMPSLRKSALELHLSRTTIENAYLQLAADGYIIAKAQSGYYVTNIAKRPIPTQSLSSEKYISYRYDFASLGVDKESFHFNIWQRYIKSALRQDDRLLSYGEPQGEYDFREVLANHVAKTRNIICNPNDIVIGASVQSLLHILCPILKEKKSVSFPNPTFVQGSTIFSDHGFDIKYRNKDCGIIYVSPAHMTKWGEIMPVKRRLELIAYAKDHDSIIIEDDFENEFVYLNKPTPSLFGLSGGNHVVYIGTFSKLLLPSIRLSFMILPPSLSEKYLPKAGFYNQTASKTEQIALCQFIRDGHLSAQTRRLKRLYLQKLKTLFSAVNDVFGKSVQVRTGSAGTSLALTIPFIKSGEVLIRKAQAKSLRLQILDETSRDVTILLSASSIKEEEFYAACQLLKEVIDSCYD